MIVELIQPNFNNMLYALYWVYRVLVKAVVHGCFQSSGRFIIYWRRSEAGRLCLELQLYMHISAIMKLISIASSDLLATENIIPWYRLIDFNCYLDLRPVIVRFELILHPQRLVSV